MRGQSVDVIRTRNRCAALNAFAHEGTEFFAGVIDIGTVDSIGFSCDDVTVAHHHVLKVERERWLINNRGAQIHQHATRIVQQAQHVRTHGNWILCRRNHGDADTGKWLGTVVWCRPLKQGAI